MASSNRDTLNALNGVALAPDDFKDYCPNGLQVEGAEEIGSAGHQWCDRFSGAIDRRGH